MPWGIPTKNIVKRGFYFWIDMNEYQLLLVHNNDNHELLWITMNWNLKLWIGPELNPEIMNWTWTNMKQHESCWIDYVFHSEAIWINMNKCDPIWTNQLINFNRRLLSTEHSSFQSSDDESAVFNDGGSEGSAPEVFKTQFQDLFNLRSVTHSAIQSFFNEI